jgi:hypothetical protein
MARKLTVSILITMLLIMIMANGVSANSPDLQINGIPNPTPVPTPTPVPDPIRLFWAEITVQEKVSPIDSVNGVLTDIVRSCRAQVWQQGFFYSWYGKGYHSSESTIAEQIINQDGRQQVCGYWDGVCSAHRTYTTIADCNTSSGLWNFFGIRNCSNSNSFFHTAGYQDTTTSATKCTGTCTGGF